MRAALLLALSVCGAAIATAAPFQEQDNPLSQAANAAEAVERGALDAETPPTTIPQTFGDCAITFRARSASVEARRPPFDCTRRHFDSLGASTSYEFLVTGNRAAAVGDLYVDGVMRPAIVARLAQRANEEQQDNPERQLDTFIRSARDAGRARCALIFDFYREGTIGVALGSDCAVENRDKLIDDLMLIESDLLLRR